MQYNSKKEYLTWTQHVCMYAPDISKPREDADISFLPHGYKNTMAGQVKMGKGYSDYLMQKGTQISGYPNFLLQEVQILLEIKNSQCRFQKRD